MCIKTFNKDIAELLSSGCSTISILSNIACMSADDRDADYTNAEGGRV